MSDPVTAVAFTGMGVQAIGQFMSTNSKAHAAQREATNRRLQAEEVLAAGRREQDLLRIRGDRATGETTQAFASSGVTMAGTPLLALEDIARQVNNESLAIERNYKFRADQLRRSADIQDELASDWQTAGMVDLLGSGLKWSGEYQTKIADKNNGSVQRVGGI